MALFDWDQLADDLAAIRAENEQTIVVRRGDTVLDAQAVRLARITAQGQAHGGAETQESRGRAVVLGATTLDIQPGDRFTDAAGVLYRVVLVRPNRRAAVIAEAEVVE